MMLLAEVALVVNGSVPDEDIVGTDIVSVTIFLFNLVLVLSVSTVPTRPHFQF